MLAGVTGVAVGLIALRTARRSVGVCLDALDRRAADGPVDSRAIRDVALYRYDALDEMTGRLSFSLALINGFGDGVVLTSINGRTETRTYARAVRGGRGCSRCRRRRSTPCGPPGSASGRRPSRNASRAEQPGHNACRTEQPSRNACRTERRAVTLPR